MHPAAGPPCLPLPLQRQRQRRQRFPASRVPRLPSSPPPLSPCLPPPCAAYFAGRRAPSPCARPALPCCAPRLQPRPAGTMSSASHDPFYSSPFGPFYRRHTSYMVQPEYRIYEMNKRLQARSEVSVRSQASRCASDRLTSRLWPGAPQLHAAWKTGRWAGGAPPGQLRSLSWALVHRRKISAAGLWGVQLLVCDPPPTHARSPVA